VLAVEGSGCGDVAMARTVAGCTGVGGGKAVGPAVSESGGGVAGSVGNRSCGGTVGGNGNPRGGGKFRVERCRLVGLGGADGEGMEAGRCRGDFPAARSVAYVEERLQVGEGVLGLGEVGPFIDRELKHATALNVLEGGAHEGDVGDGIEGRRTGLRLVELLPEGLNGAVWRPRELHVEAVLGGGDIVELAVLGVEVLKNGECGDAAEPMDARTEATDEGGWYGREELSLQSGLGVEVEAMVGDRSQVGAIGLRDLWAGGPGEMDGCNAGVHGGGVGDGAVESKVLGGRNNQREMAEHAPTPSGGNGLGIAVELKVELTEGVKCGRGGLKERGENGVRVGMRHGRMVGERGDSGSRVGGVVEERDQRSEEGTRARYGERVVLSCSGGCRVRE